MEIQIDLKYVWKFKQNVIIYSRTLANSMYFLIEFKIVIHKHNCWLSWENEEKWTTEPTWNDMFMTENMQRKKV